MPFNFDSESVNVTHKHLRCGSSSMNLKLRYFSACKPGYYGNFCNKPCPPGNFGKRCGGRCYPKCSNEYCDPVEGCLFIKEKKLNTTSQGKKE